MFPRAKQAVMAPLFEITFVVVLSKAGVRIL